MKKVKKWNRSIALMAAYILLALTMRPNTAYGALGIDTTRTDCSITFELGGDNWVIQNNDKATSSVPGGGNTASGSQPSGGSTATDSSPGFDELLKYEIKVKLYKVADVDESGKYVAPVPASYGNVLYQTLQGNLNNVSSNTTADEWLKMAASASDVVKATGSNVESTKETTLTGSGGQISGLSTGLYLVVADDVTTDQFIYHFTPYLVSLPGNDYYEEGVASPSDAWQYEVTVGLKPGREERLGNLAITKKLSSFNNTLKGATCIFQIEAEKDGKVVYSDVKSIVFNGPGTDTIKINGKIPAGAKVTVTEVYSGSSYVMDGTDPNRTTWIVADGDVGVSFSNSYDDRFNGGTSVVNHFENTAGENETANWAYRPLVDSNREGQQQSGGGAEQ